MAGQSQLWSTVTRHTYHLHLEASFHWLTLMGYRADNPMIKMGKPRRPRSVPRPVSDDGLRRLLASRMRPRTRAMVLLAALQGLRVHEIAKLRAEDLDLVAGKLVVTGKGGVTAVLPLHQLVIQHSEQMHCTGFWFPGADRVHQRREAVGQTIKDAMARARVPVSAHQLRHWFGTALVQEGADLRTVQELMRHQNLTSTAIYTAVSDKQLPLSVL